MGKSLSALFLYNTLFNKVSQFNCAYLSRINGKLRMMFCRIAQVFNDVTTPKVIATPSLGNPDLTCILAMVSGEALESVKVNFISQKKVKILG